MSGRSAAPPRPRSRRNPAPPRARRRAATPARVRAREDPGCISLQIAQRLQRPEVLPTFGRDVLERRSAGESEEAGAEGGQVVVVGGGDPGPAVGTLAPEGLHPPERVEVVRLVAQLELVDGAVLLEAGGGRERAAGCPGRGGEAQDDGGQDSE